MIHFPDARHSSRGSEGQAIGSACWYMILQFWLLQLHWSLLTALTAITTPAGVNDNATAEVAIMMLLMLLRRVDEARTAFQNRIIGDPVGHEVDGKTLGIIGMGRVGKCMAAAAAGLGMKVISTDSRSTHEDLEQLLQQSDVVSLHCQLNHRTKGLIGHQELALMKQGAVLLNTARGPVIDQEALLEALNAGKLAGVGLDVHWVEPADPQQELYRWVVRHYDLWLK